MTDLVLWGVVPPTAARVNWGRWVADCPMCRSALALRPGTPAFECYDCYARVEVIWPSVDVQAGVERVLSFRPDPRTRNWTNDETVQQLHEENLDHGLGVLALEVPDDGVTFAVAGDSILVDALPATRFVLPSMRRLMLTEGA